MISLDNKRIEKGQMLVISHHRFMARYETFLLNSHNFSPKILLASVSVYGTTAIVEPLLNRIYFCSFAYSSIFHQMALLFSGVVYTGGDRFR